MNRHIEHHATEPVIMERVIEQERVAAFILQEGGEIARDMGTHVAEQIFELLKRNGMLMRSEAGVTAMLTHAAMQVLSQAIDQCSRAAEDDCTSAVLTLFRDLLPENVQKFVKLETTSADTTESTP